MGCRSSCWPCEETRGAHPPSDIRRRRHLLRRRQPVVSGCRQFFYFFKIFIASSSTPSITFSASRFTCRCSRPAHPAYWHRQCRVPAFSVGSFSASVPATYFCLACLLFRRPGADARRGIAPCLRYDPLGPRLGLDSNLVVLQVEGPRWLYRRYS